MDEQKKEDPPEGAEQEIFEKLSLLADAIQNAPLRWHALNEGVLALRRQAIEIGSLEDDE